MPFMGAEAQPSVGCSERPWPRRGADRAGGRTGHDRPALTREGQAGWYRPTWAVVRCREAYALQVAPLLMLLSGCALFGPGTARYAVFFPERSAQLDAAAQGVIAQAAGRARDDPDARVRVVGYTDSAGSPQADVALSRQRAQAVADALVADGVAASRLVRTGRGQTGEDPDVASRRVEVSVGGP